jgi:hypothetical protein
MEETGNLAEGKKILSKKIILIRLFSCRRFFLPWDRDLCRQHLAIGLEPERKFIFRAFDSCHFPTHSSPVHFLPGGAPPSRLIPPHAEAQLPSSAPLVPPSQAAAA